MAKKGPDSFFNISFNKGSLSKYNDAERNLQRGKRSAVENYYHPEGKQRINSDNSVSFGSYDSHRELLGNDSGVNQRAVKQGFLQLQRTVNLLVFGVVLVALMMLLLTIIVIQTKGSAESESNVDTANLAGKLQALAHNNLGTASHNATEGTSTLGQTSTTPIIPDVVCDSLTSSGYLTIKCDDENKIGSVCKLTCRPPYKLDGEDTVTCVENENSPLNGAWSSSVSSCIPPGQVCTTIPSQITNGVSKCTDGSRKGSVCKFSCYDGYMLRGASSVTCTQGSWSESIPFCQADACTQIQPCENEGECIVDKTGIDYTCNCQRGWTGDFCSKALSVQFKLYITTSSVTWSGTDAVVQVILYGESDRVCGPYKFDGSKGDWFENSRTDEFLIDCNFLGKLNKINIGHDGQKAHSDWHLASVTVNDLYLDETYEFSANMWLKDGAKYVELTPINV